MEPVLAVRGSVLHSLLQVGMAEMRGEDSVPVEQKRRVECLFKALRETLLTHSRWAREAANYQVSGELFVLGGEGVVFFSICSETYHVVL